MLRSLAGARAAFDSADTEASRLAHTPRTNATIEEPGHDGPLGMPIFNYKIQYYAETGLMISLILLAAISGAEMDGRLLLQVGFPVLAAIAVSFGISELKGETHARLRYKRERRREQWELENFAKGEKQEMVELYVQRGMKEEDAEVVISKMAKYEQFFVDIMMMEGEHRISSGPF